MYNCMKDINWNERLKKLNGQKVALYGAGKYGKIALENIKKYLPQLEIVCFLDDNKVRNDHDIAGLRVTTLDELMEQDESFNILITNYYVTSVLEKIENKGFDINKIFFWGELLIEDVEERVFHENKKHLQKVYCCLEDYLSKMLLQSMVTARFSKNIDLFSLSREGEQYFPENIFKLNEEEVFVDAGAYDGDTIEAFLAHTKQRYKYIYAFEPDNTNYESLLCRNYKKNIKIFHAGLYSETKEISFSANKGGSSRIEGEGNGNVQVLKFDDLELPEKNITFIKMDIEGSELEALQGMEKSIKKYRPKLAVCIYHKFEDLWKIPLYIKSLVPQYKLYIRNYTAYMDEVVLYAVV